jgi:ATP-dependent RNA helicase DHX37/DHR1
VKQKRRRAVQLSRAGFDIPEELLLFKISGNQKVSENSVVAKQVCPAKFVELAKCKHHDMGYKNNSMNDSAKYKVVRDAVVSMPVPKTGEPCDDALVSTPKIHSFTLSCSGDLQVISLHENYFRHVCNILNI